ncbi:MAG: 50S ribosomal protein L9 [Cycloclasticus sp. symbiont of Poecilosclerida sp. M]|nr:MAG: 50S ribosomal protein L9 [Cycloclasticus sp. symbiont of Poecilosclerida sp. M]
MDVILLEKIANLGDLGEKVSVKPGFGRNFLIPEKKAVLATEERMAEFEKRRAELEKAAAESLAAAKVRAEGVGKLALTITHQVGEEGKLFGSVGISDVIKAAADAGVEIAKSEVQMPDGVLKQIGDFEVAINLHTDITVALKLAIVAEE